MKCYQTAQCLVLCCLIPTWWIWMHVETKDAYGQANYTLEELIENTRATESKIRTLAVTVEWSNTTTHMTKDLPTEAKASMVETWHIDTAGVGWAEGQGSVAQRDTNGLITVLAERFSATFDGSVGNRLWHTTVDGRSDTYASIEKRLQGRSDSPLLFVDRVSSLLEKGRFEIAESQGWEGRDVVVLKKTYANTDTKRPKRKTEIWIDPTLQFAVVRRRQFIQVEPGSDWEVEWSRDAHEHQEIVDGVWLPETGSHEMKRPQSPVAVKSQYVFTGWKVNEEIDRERLHLDFPEGIRVRNSPAATVEK